MKAQEKPMSSLAGAFFYEKWTRRQSAHDATLPRMLWAVEAENADMDDNGGSHA